MYLGLRLTLIYRRTVVERRRSMISRALFALVPRIIVACALMLVINSPSRAAQVQQDKLQAARLQLALHFADIQHRMGLAQAADLEERLDSDLAAVSIDTPPESYPSEDWNERLRGVAELDASIVTQVLSGKSDAVAGSRGLVERLIVSRTDRTLEPFALYVPSSLTANSTLVILLHGRPQTETEILSSPYFRKLADSTGTIVAAPYGRGLYDFAPPADDEVYQVTDEVGAAFHISSQRVFLVGYSMGGFSVFKIGPRHPRYWAAIMCIAGSILNSNAEAVRTAFQKTPIYVITGEKDQSIPPSYPKRTAAYLASVGIPTGLYEEPSGTHYLATLLPALSAAWHDMIAGHISRPAVPNVESTAPESMPPPNGVPVKP